MEAYYGNGKYIFISYAHKDEKIVYPIIEELQNYFNVWYDNGIEIGEDFRRDILNHLSYSALFLFFVTPNSLASGFCKKEIHFAESRNINFINILLEDFSLPDWFDFDYGHLQHFPFYKYKNISQAVAELVRRKLEWFTPVTGDELVFSGITIEEMFGIKKDEPSSKAQERKALSPKQDIQETAKPQSETKPILDIKPTISKDKKTIKFGLYPQTVVNDKKLIDELNSQQGNNSGQSDEWILYKDKYYVKITAKPFRFVKDHRFNNGDTIIDGETYWFKCEPIVWNIFHKDDKRYYAVSSVILDTFAFYSKGDTRKINFKTVYPNNYKYSDIRAWLNGYDGSSYNALDYIDKGFINLAFGDGGSYLEVVNVDNKAGTAYDSEDTEDKVFLLSRLDYLLEKYGFASLAGPKETRYCKATDFARARGIRYGDQFSFLGAVKEKALYNGVYWTRSPIQSRDSGIVTINYFGDIDPSEHYNEENGVRPAIAIKIK